MAAAVLVVAVLCGIVYFTREQNTCEVLPARAGAPEKTTTMHAAGAGITQGRASVASDELCARAGGLPACVFVEAEP